MSKNVVTILDSDPLAREALSVCCAAEGLSDQIDIIDPADYQAGAGPVLSLQIESTSIPDVPEADIFTKPVRVGRVVARVEHHLRRLKDSELPAQIKIGPYKLDWRDHNLVHGKDETRMTEKETAILKLLYEHEGKAVSRDVLLDTVWGYADGVETHTLETHIYRLRQKIEKDAAAPKILITNDDGYVLKR